MENGDVPQVDAEVIEMPAKATSIRVFVTTYNNKNEQQPTVAVLMPLDVSWEEQRSILDQAVGVQEFDPNRKQYFLENGGVRAPLTDPSLIRESDIILIKAFKGQGNKQYRTSNSLFAETDSGLKYRYVTFGFLFGVCLGLGLSWYLYNLISGLEEYIPVWLGFGAFFGIIIGLLVAQCAYLCLPEDPDNDFIHVANNANAGAGNVAAFAGSFGG